MNTEHHKEIAQKILAYCGEEVLAVETTIRSDLGVTLINFRLTDGKKFIYNQGEALRAFNTVIRSIVEKNVGTLKETAWLIDINNFYFHYIEDIQQGTRHIIEKVKKTGKPHDLPPQNPFDRRIVHHTVQSDGHVISTSEGEGFERHIVISLKESGE
ncbi:MAG TPA: R3H domain-containing nucleic acid-binding protein [Candidatus Paceibacterota bacterium]